MTVAMPHWASRALAVGILTALVAVVYGASVEPFIEDYGETAQAVERMSALLGRYRKTGQELPAIQAEFDRMKQRPDSANGFFQAATDTLIAAQLQGKIRTAVDSAHGELKSTQVLPTQDEGAMRKVTVRSQMTSNWGTVQRVLYEIETSSPYLFVDNINVRARGADRRIEGIDQDPILDVRFDVSGFMIPGK
jgi:general secretion pathway protein M